MQTDPTDVNTIRGLTELCGIDMIHTVVSVGGGQVDYP